MQKDGNKVLRGHVYWVTLDPTIGSEVNKTRPAIVVSNDIQNYSASRVIVVPLTSNVQKVYNFEALVKVGDKAAKAMTDQIRTIDKSRIGKFIAATTNDEMQDLDRAIKITLSLR